MRALSVAIDCILFYSKKILLGILLLVFSVIFVRGQVPGMKVYSQFDGYTATIGYVITQDDKGFIWVGTDKGAICFDGKRFKVIDDRMGLIDQEILMAAPCNDGRVMLVPLLNNISYYQDGKVITPQQNPSLKQVRNKQINHTRIDKSTGKIWLCDEGVNKTIFCFYDGIVTKQKLDIGIGFFSITVINNRILMQLKDDRRTLLWYNVLTHKKDTLRIPFDYSITSLINVSVTDDAKLLVINDVGREKITGYRIEGDTGIKLFDNYTQGPLYHVVVDRNNHLWILSSDNGIEYWGDITKITNTSSPVRLFKNVTINYLFVDRDDNVWLTTRGDGLYFLSQKHWQNARQTMPLNLADMIPACVTGDAGKIFFGHKRAKLSILENQKTTVFELPIKRSQSLSFIKPVSDKIVIAGRDNMMYLSSIEAPKQLTRVHNIHTIKDVTNSDDKTLLMATHDGVYLVKAKENWVIGTEQCLYLGRATSVSMSKSGVILIGTPNGLYVKQSANAPHKKVIHTALSEANITALTLAGKEYILIGTSVNGLYTYNYKTGEVKLVNKVLKQSTGSIKQIYLQNDSVYWLSTDRGAYRIRFDDAMVDREVKIYTFFDGLPSNNVSAIYAQNDTVYLTTSGGLGILLPNREATTASHPPVVWVSVAKYSDTTLQFPQKLTLGPGQNDVQLSLSAISYESFGNIKFQYRLLGLTDNWVTTESPDISFSGLPPGQYQLQVFGLNYNGVKSLKVLTLPIIVLPSFWQTWWFMLFIAVFILVGIAFLILWWVQRYKSIHYKQLQQKRKLAELELEAIKAQINPHFVFNCLNSIQVFSYKNEHDLVKQYINLFAKLIRQTMQYSQETFITLGEEREYLINYLKLEKIRFKDKLNYKLWMDESLSSTTLIPAMLVQPYVENALKHGVAAVRDREGLVEINFFKNEEGGLIITIEDNGPGLPAQTTNNSRKTLGMRLSGSRAQTYNQLFNLNVQVHIRANTVMGYGTVIELIIPSIAHENTKF